MTAAARRHAHMSADAAALRRARCAPRRGTLGAESPSCPDPCSSAPSAAPPLASAAPPVVLDVRWSLPGRRVARRTPPATCPARSSSTSTPSSPTRRDGSRGRHPLPRPGALRRRHAPRGRHPRPPGRGHGRRRRLRRRPRLVAAAPPRPRRRPPARRRARRLGGGRRPRWPTGADARRRTTTTDRATASASPPTAARLPVLDADGAADARAPTACCSTPAPAPRYAARSSPSTAVAGHIPGAVERAALDSVDADGRFLRRDELARRFADLGVHAGRAGGRLLRVRRHRGAHGARSRTARHRRRALPRLVVGVGHRPARPVATGPSGR